MKLENYEIIENDHEIIDILKECAPKNVFKLLDNALNNQSGMMIVNIKKNNIEYPAIILKFIKKNDSGLGLIISNTTYINPLFPLMEFFFKEFKINITLEEFIAQSTI